MTAYQVDLYLCRDLDSRISKREVAAVQEWVSTDAAVSVLLTLFDTKYSPRCKYPRCKYSRCKYSRCTPCETIPHIMFLSSAPLGVLGSPRFCWHFTGQRQLSSFNPVPEGHCGILHRQTFERNGDAVGKRFCQTLSAGRLALPKGPTRKGTLLPEATH